MYQNSTLCGKKHKVNTLRCVRAIPIKDRVESSEQRENFNETRGCTWLITRRTIPIFFVPLVSLVLLSLFLFLSSFLFSLLSTAIVAVITIFLRPPSGLSSNDLSIEPRAGNHRTSANGTANGCVLLVPLHLPHYTQFSAGDLIGFPLLILLLCSLLPARSSSRPVFFSPFFLLVLYMATCAIDRKIPFFWRF